MLFSQGYRHTDIHAPMHKGIWYTRKCRKGCKHVHMHAYICSKGMAYTRGHRYACIQTHKHAQRNWVHQGAHMCTHAQKVYDKPGTHTSIHTNMHSHICTKALRDIRGHRHTCLHVHTMYIHMYTRVLGDNS